jgi:tetratricopeptide (TPR) repeat protein
MFLFFLFKVRGLATHLDELISQIRSDQEKQPSNKTKEPLTFTTFNPNVTKEQLTSGLNGEFIHSQLLIDCILQIKSTSADINELISLCEQEYQDDKKQLPLVQKFKREYSSDRALLWYTGDAFVYLMLNRALRTQNIHLLFLFRFLIRDLENQLKDNRCTSRLTVYRGQLMSNKEFETLKKSVEELISINSFLSTSLDRSSAYSFLRDSNDLERVLFEIDADPKIRGVKPFANITSLSSYPEEEEVLFMLGSIFRLVNITRDRNGVWTVKLTLCSDHDHDLKAVFNHMKSQDMQGELDLVILGDVLQRMGKYNEAEKYYRRCLRELPSDDYKNISICYYALGRLADSKGDYETSLKWFNKSLEIDMEFLKPDDPNIANTHNSIANIYQMNGDYNQALESYNKALTIFQRALGESDPHVATCLNNIGAVYQRQKKYSEALGYYHKALAIRKKHLPADHPDIGASYNNIGIVHRHLGDSDQALEQYNLALRIYKRSLPPQHPDIAMTLGNIGIVYEEKHNWKQALSYYKEAAAIYNQAYSSTHPDVVQTEQSVQRVSSKLK